MLVIDIPEEVILFYEWVEEDLEGRPFPKSYREFLIPAEIANRYGPPRACTEEEVDEAETERRRVYFSRKGKGQNPFDQPPSPHLGEG